MRVSCRIKIISTLWLFPALLCASDADNKTSPSACQHGHICTVKLCGHTHDGSQDDWTKKKRIREERGEKGSQHLESASEIRCRKYLEGIGRYVKAWMMYDPASVPGMGEDLSRLNPDLPIYFLCNEKAIPPCPHLSQGSPRFSCSACPPCDSDSYYHVTGYDPGNAPLKDIPYLFDRLENHHGFVHVLFLDGHVEKLKLTKEPMNAETILRLIRKQHPFQTTLECETAAQKKIMEQERLYLHAPQPPWEKEVAATLAKTNGLTEDSVSFSCRFGISGNQITLRFQQVPKSGTYELGELVPQIRQSTKISRIEKFLVFLPGGSAESFLKLKTDELSIWKGLRSTVSFPKESGAGPGKLSLSGFTIEEVMALPEQLAMEQLFLSPILTFDWTLLNRFPKLKKLSLQGTRKFLHAEEVRGRTLESLSVMGCDNPILPEQLRVTSAVFTTVPITPAFLHPLHGESLRMLSFNKCEGVQALPSLEQFVNCREIVFDSTPKLTNLNLLKGLKHLNRIEIRNAVDLSDFTALKSLPGLKELRYYGRIDAGQILDGLPLDQAIIGQGEGISAPDPNKIWFVKRLLVGKRFYRSGVEAQSCPE